jgi:AcrR family transcriptional regulator
MLKSAIMKETETNQKSADLFGSIPGTRERIIEAAGVIFSEKGFDRTTGRQICDLARVNSAAVNYHFGGKERLYVEVLREANRRLINSRAIEVAAQDAGAVEEWLEAVLRALLHTMLDPSPEGWATKVCLREMSAPSIAVEELVELQLRPTAQMIRTLVGQIMNLPIDHLAVVRGSLGLMGQLIFIFQNRQTIELIFPDLDLRGDGIDEMARHIRRVTIAGLSALARDIPEGDREHE